MAPSAIIAAAIGALAAGSLVAAPASAATLAAPPAAQATQKPTLPKNIAKTAPEFVQHPRLVGSHIEFSVRLTPWRTSGKHTNRTYDKASARIRIANKNTPVREVSLAPKAQRTQLVYKKMLTSRTVKKPGVYKYSVKVPTAAKYLTKMSLAKQRQQVQVVFRHRKDVTDVRGRDVLMLAQSNVYKKSYAYPSSTKKAAAASSQLSSSFNPDVIYSVENNTPFTLTGTQAGTNCFNNLPADTVTLGAGQWVIMNSVTPMTENGTANDQSLWQSLTSGAVSSAGSAAKQAAPSALDAAVTGSTAGLTSAFTGFAKSFLTGLISDIKKNQCSNGAQSQTWTTSWAATDVASPSAYYTGGYSAANWDVYGTQVDTQIADLSTPVPTQYQLSGAALEAYVGTQSTVQWNWDNGFVNMDGPAGSSFTGGLTAITAAAPDNGMQNMWTELTFDNTTDQSYGPIPTGAGYTASVSGTSVQCQVPAANLVVPFSQDSLSLNDPPAGYSLTAYSTATILENAASGWTPVTNPSVNPPTQYQANGGFATGSIGENLQGNLNTGTQYGCAFGANVQVPSYASGGKSMNLSWSSAPALLEQAPTP